jgi:ABC-type multidrug transport system fused ATPase/permease subunit
VFKAIRNFLKPRDQINYGLSIVLLSITNILDVIGVGLIASLLIKNQSSTEQNFTKNFMSQISLNSTQIFILIFSIFLAKGVISLLLINRFFKFLANCATKISKKLFSGVVQQSLDLLVQTSSQKLSVSLIQGCNEFVIIGFGNLGVVISESLMLTIMALFLFALYPELTLFFSTLFLLASIIVLKFTVAKTERIGSDRMRADSKAYETVQYSIAGFRDLYSSRSLDKAIDRYANSRTQGTEALRKIILIGFLPKYYLELIGILILGFAFILDQVFAQGFLNTAAVVTFAGAASRILPSLIRLNTAFNSVKAAYGSSESVRELSNVVAMGRVFKQSPSSTILPVIDQLNTMIAFEDVSFKYSNTNSEIIKNLSFRLLRNERVGIVGPSGIGKSTIFDLILGVREPNSGSVKICGIDSKNYYMESRVKIGIVTQDILIIPGTLRENLIGFEGITKTESELASVVETCELKYYVNTLGRELDEDLSESGKNISGGIRQRIGLARVLLSEPDILLLDEVTSGLDSGTEERIMSALLNKLSSSTVLIISHRLSTVKNMDRILFFKSKDEVIFETFDWLVENCREFKELIFYQGNFD